MIADAGLQRIFALEPDRPHFVQIAAELDAITGGNLVDQPPARRVAMVWVRGVQHAAVVDGHGAGRNDQVHYVFSGHVVRVFARIGAATGELPVSVVVVGGPAQVAARNHAHAAVFRHGVVQEEHTRQQVVVGVGKEGEVLVPVHLAFALGRRFPVQLAVLQAQILTDKLRHRTQHHRMPRGLHEGVVE